MKVLAVAWREFRYTALTKAFIFAAVILPLVFYGSIPLILMVTKKRVPPLVGTVAIIDTTSEVADNVRLEFAPDQEEARRQRAVERMAELTEAAQDPAKAAEAVKELRENPDAATDLIGAGTVVDITLEFHDTVETLDDLKTRLVSGDLLAIAQINPEALDPDSTTDERAIDLYVPAGIKADHSQILRHRLSEAVIRARTARTGDDLANLRTLLRGPPVNAIGVTRDGREAQEHSGFKEFLPYAFMFLLWIAAFTGGQYLLTTTVEEKSNKLMEVLLSAISPGTLMTGKILGQGLVALVMMLMYGGLGIAALLHFATGDAAPWMVRILLIVYFIMAYFYVASLMAAVGSAVSDLHEAQTLMGPAMIVMLAPMILMIPASQNPNGMLAVVSSFIPPCTPFIMVVRIGAGEVPTGQIIATIVFGYIGVAISLWACARIFRVGVLMQGKPPTPMELLKWVRYR